MFSRFGALAAALLGATLLPGVASSASDPPEGYKPLQYLRRQLQPSSCSDYDIQYPTTTENTVFWVGGGGSDSEWINAANWQYGYLPGVHKFNRLIMAVNDRGTVSCDATYMVVPPSLEARSGATLHVSADLQLDQLVLKTQAAVTQSGSSVVMVSKNLYLAASYSMSDHARLSLGLDLYMASNARLAIAGESATLTASGETSTISQIHGEVKYVLGPSGAGAIDLGGPLTVGSTTARIVVDASSYAGGSATIPLIRYTSLTGSFAASNIAITGVSGGMAGSVVQEDDGVYLVIVGGEPSTAEPTNHPTTKPTGFPSNEPTPSPSHGPVTDEPTPQPTPVPTHTPITPQPTSNPTDPPVPVPTEEPTPPPSPSPTPDPTPAPSPAPTPGPTDPTSNPTDPPVPVPTDEPTPPPTNDPVSASATRLVLTESGFDPIVDPGGTCPPPEATEIVIDGSAYAGGPNTVVLYECGSVDADYDLMKIRLENFEEGLWFEIGYKAGTVELSIKSLADYREYHNTIRLRYDHDWEYPESTEEERSRFPGFDWNTIPTWVRYYKNTRSFEPDELQSISKHFISWYGLGSKEHVTETLSGIKAYNASHKALLYWNAEAYWPEDWASSHPGWGGNAFLNCCKFGTNNRRLWKHWSAGFRDWWVNSAKAMAQHPDIDGVMTDNTMSQECKNLACDDTATHKSRMIERLARELDEPGSKALDIGNYLRQNFNSGNRYRLAYADGSYFENQHKGLAAQDSQRPGEAIIVSMQLAREASWKKKLVLWTGSKRNCNCVINNPNFKWNENPSVYDLCYAFKGAEDNSTPAPTELIRQDLEKTLAEYLLIAEEYSYFNFNVGVQGDCERWRWDSSAMGLDEFDRPLGRPLGPPIKSGHNFSRHFEHVSVRINTLTQETQYIWK